MVLLCNSLGTKYPASRPSDGRRLQFISTTYPAYSSPASSPASSPFINYKRLLCLRFLESDSSSVSGSSLDAKGTPGLLVTRGSGILAEYHTVQQLFRKP
jgi:hypothetical protein